MAMSDKSLKSGEEVNSAEEIGKIFSLPDEVIAFILKNKTLSTVDILHFGLSCKRFYNVVVNNNFIWKSQMCYILPAEVFEVIKSASDGNWYYEAKQFFTLRKSLYSEVIKLSHKYYGYRFKYNIFMLEEFLVFMKLAVSRNINYYVTIWILCELVKSANRYIYIYRNSKKPYTLTDAFYAKMTAQYLVHQFLIIKWSQMGKLNEQPPEKVLHFFIQWVDTSNLHSEEDDNDMINDVVRQVENVLDKNHPLRAVSQAERHSWARGHLNNNKWDSSGNRAVLLATKCVLYEINPMVLLPVANEETLDLKKVLTKRRGNAIAFATIFSAVARRCGVRCDVIAFAHHMFLEWRDDYSSGAAPAPRYTVNLSTGQLELKRQCPFSRASSYEAGMQYNPNSMLVGIAVTFSEHLGAIINTTTNNIEQLYKLLGNDHPIQIRNLNYLAHEMSRPKHRCALESPINIKYIDPLYLRFLGELANMNNAVARGRRPIAMYRVIQPKPHPSHVRYAVGMVCFHIKLEYVCVIIDWDETCRQSAEWQSNMDIASLEYKNQQPFYSVMAIDYSTRYVAQENLRVIKDPHQLSGLEEEIGRFFNHFDGFAYIPNDQKAAEYPQDGPIREMHRIRSLAPSHA